MYFSWLFSSNVYSKTCMAVQQLYTSSSESLLNDGEKPNQPKRYLCPKCDYGKISVLALSKSDIHKSIYRNDGHSGKTDAFCKHKSSPIHNRAIEVIYILPRSGHDA